MWTVSLLLEFRDLLLPHLNVLSKENIDFGLDLSFLLQFALQTHLNGKTFCRKLERSKTIVSSAFDIGSLRCRTVSIPVFVIHRQNSVALEQTATVFLIR